MNYKYLGAFLIKSENNINNSIEHSEKMPFSKSRYIAPYYLELILVFLSEIINISKMFDFNLFTVIKVWMHGDHDTVPIEEISKKNIMNNKHSNFEKSVGNCERNERIMCIL